MSSPEIHRCGWVHLCTSHTSLSFVVFKLSTKSRSRKMLFVHKSYLFSVDKSGVFITPLYINSTERVWPQVLNVWQIRIIMQVLNGDRVFLFNIVLFLYCFSPKFLFLLPMRQDTSQAFCKDQVVCQRSFVELLEKTGTAEGAGLWSRTKMFTLEWSL